MIEVEDTQHFLTNRFDHNGDMKLHMQTLAALYPEADSYEKILMVCRKMRLPESTQEEVFRRMVFNYFANSTDDHNKNFSFLMDESGRWKLSPAYDLTYIFNTGGYLPETMHCLMMRGKYSGWTKEDAISLAKESGIRKTEAIIAKTAEAIKRFRAIAEKYKIKKCWIGAIEQTLFSNMEAWGFAGSVEDSSLTIDNHKLSDIRMEQTYRGNYHLLAKIDGIQRKFVISKKRRIPFH